MDSGTPETAGNNRIRSWRRTNYKKNNNSEKPDAELADLSELTGYFAGEHSQKKCNYKKERSSECSMKRPFIFHDFSGRIVNSRVRDVSG